MTRSMFSSAVAAHRERCGLTQQQLGEMVGYGKTGASVSISRVETGWTIPTATRTKALANAFGLTGEELERFLKLRDKAAQEAAKDRAPAKKQNLRQLKEQVEITLNKRVAITEKLAEMNQEAIELASAGFFNKLVEVAAQINDAPKDKLFTVRVVQLDTMENTHLARAQQQLDHITQNIVVSFTGVGTKILLDSLAGATVGAAGGAVMAYATYASIARFGYASTGTPNSTLHGVTLKNSVLATMGGGTIANGGGGMTGGTRAIVGTIAGGAIIGLTNALTESAIQAAFDRQKARKELEAQKQELEATASRFAKWQAAVARSTEILTYIGVHGAHALEKWVETLGSLPRNWTDLTEHQQQKFREMLTIAGCKSSVDMTPIDQLMSCSDDELVEVEAEVEATFTAAEVTVKALV